jgi:hypothetical protein
VFEVVIIMGGLSRFPQRESSDDFKIIIFPRKNPFDSLDVRALVQHSRALPRKSEIRCIDISGFPLE